MPTRKQAGFVVLPAIDLRGGRVVRLTKGDFAREQVYADDPAQVASSLRAAGAEWVHVVDLDGAKAGERRQTEVIRRIRRSLGREVRLEVGGGVRSSEAVDETLAAGADRVVLGTAAIHDRGLIERLVERVGESRLAVALDVRDGIAVGQGWVPAATGRSMEEAVETLTGAGVRTFIVTAIDRDGLLGGPDLRLLERVTELTDADVIASGGIATLEDLEATRRIGCRGAVVGRAFYDGRIDLREAIAATR